MYLFTLLASLQANSTEIENAIKQTAENTSAVPWTVSAFVVALLSLIVAIVAAFIAYKAMIYARNTLNAQVQTEKNTNRLDLDVQKNLLVEMCRHLYRNMVVSYTVSLKLEQCNFTAYPSEEHLAKMKINLEDIHDELFYKGNNDAFFDISKLYTLLLNYNIELDIISNHLKSPSIDIETKRRDISTLLFKCGFLTGKINDFILMVWSEQDKDKDAVKNIIKGAMADNQKDNHPNYQGKFTPYNNQETFYVNTLFRSEDEKKEFFRNFNLDVRIEMGANKEGADKIHLIKF
ncbi:MAG: hypothetical protein IJ626_01905 [Muribaculaceae bacterium]|nr:hypothetical protein [Muribaculaceae bacterium]